MERLHVLGQLPVGVMKWPLPGPSVDVFDKIVILAQEPSCLMNLTFLDGVQAAAQVPLDSMKWPLPDPCFDLID